MQHIFQKRNENLEWCFNIETTKTLTAGELNILKYILAEGFVIGTVSDDPFIANGKKPIELGPRMNFATAASTNLVVILIFI